MASSYINATTLRVGGSRHFEVKISAMTQVTPRPLETLDVRTPSENGGARSLTNAVYEHLRTDIITNRLQQGVKLPMAQFQEQFGVSLSVVREALARLAAEGLVVSEAQRGFRVRPISKADLIDVTRTRIAIEGIAIRWAIDRGDDAWLASVQDAYARLSGIIRASEVEQWSNAHARFHQILLEPCGSEWLLRFRGVLFEQSERYRHAAIQNVPPTLQSDVDVQHRILVDAVLQRNPEKAQMAIDAHFSSTMKRVLDCLPPDDTEN